jgi:hypothetical protein
MKVNVQLDPCGWSLVDPANLAKGWESVTCDQMTLVTVLRDPGFPALDDLPALRLYYKQFLIKQSGALIACDVIGETDKRLVRVISKGPSGKGQGMRYAGSLLAPVGKFLVSVVITGDEDNLTGVREAVMLAELLSQAGPAEQRQWAEGQIPIEWKFERYEPGTRGPWAYLLSDDEKYDARFPDHPLTRVRRWLRRLERTFRITAEAPVVATPQAPKESEKAPGIWGSMLGKLRPARESENLRITPLPEKREPEEEERLDINIQAVPLKPMAFQEIVNELGFQVASDAMSMEALRQMTPPMSPAMATRQKVFSDQRDKAMKKILDDFQEGQERLKQIREDAEVLLKDLKPETTTVWVARQHGSAGWHTVVEPGAGVVMPIFTSEAAAEDFIAAGALDCEPEALSVTALYAALSRPERKDIAAVEYNRCPRCNYTREVVSRSSISGEMGLLKHYAVNIAGRKRLAEKNMLAASLEIEAAKRLAILQYTVDHINHGDARLHTEIARLAVGTGNAYLLEKCRRILGKYWPSELAALDADLAGLPT